MQKVVLGNPVLYLSLNQLMLKGVASKGVVLKGVVFEISSAFPSGGGFFYVGCLVYHGPREQVMDFFESCGFACPERKGIADFLQEVTSRKDQKV